MTALRTTLELRRDHDADVACLAPPPRWLALSINNLVRAVVSKEHLLCATGTEIQALAM